MAVHGDHRPSLVLTGPARFRFQTLVRREGRLAFAVVVRPVEAAVRLRVAVHDGGGRHDAYDEVWRGHRAWQDRTVDLAGFAWKTVWIEFTLTGDPATVALGFPEVVGRAPADRPNVLVYVVDCLRADHVGAYGYHRPTTPAIDRLAAEGVVFEKAYSCAAWTKPAVGCLFTSTYPWRHGVRTVASTLAEDVTTVAEAFQSAGYATHAWVANPLVDRSQSALGRGFDRFVALAQRWVGKNVNLAGAEADASALNEALRWLERNRRRSFFLYLHSLDLHAPYEPRPPFDASFVRAGTSGIDAERDLYDNEVAYNDREIGRLMDGLRGLGIYDSTLVVITADHGEEFMEHAVARHGRSLHDEALHVPLVVKLPAGRSAGHRVAAAVNSLDIAPTLLEYATVARPATFEGVGLAGLVAGGEPPRRPLFAEQLGPRQALYAVRHGGWKYVRELLPAPRELLYDLRRDPHEQASLAAQSAPAGLTDALASFIDQGLDGYHVLLDAGAGGPTRVRGDAVGGFKDVIQLITRTGDVLDFKPGASRFEYTVVPGEPARHLVLRTTRRGDGVRLWIGSGDRAVRGREVAVGSGPHHPSRVPFTVEPVGSAVPTYAAGDALGRDARAWVWYLAPRSQPVAPGEALAAQLRTLGYVQ